MCTPDIFWRGGCQFCCVISVMKPTQEKSSELKTISYQSAPCLRAPHTHTFVKNNKRLKPVRDEIQLIDECDDVEGEDRDLGNRRLEYSMGLFFYRYTHAWRDVQ